MVDSNGGVIQEIERIRGLDIVMAVEQNGRFAGSTEPLTLNHRGSGRFEEPRLQTRLAQQRHLRRGTPTNTDVLGTDACLGDKAQHVREVVAIGFGGPEHAVKLCDWVGHERSASPGWRGTEGSAVRGRDVVTTARREQGAIIDRGAHGGNVPGALPIPTGTDDGKAGTMRSDSGGGKEDGEWRGARGLRGPCSRTPPPHGMTWHAPPCGSMHAAV